MRDPYEDEARDDWLRCSNPSGIEDAWTRVQAELGNLGTVAGVSRTRSRDLWIADATGPHHLALSGNGSTPALALLDLLNVVRDRRRQR